MDSNSRNKHLDYDIIFVCVSMIYLVIGLGLFVCDLVVFTAVFTILDPTEGLKFADFNFLLWGMRSLGFLLGMVLMNTIMSIKSIKDAGEKGLHGSAILKLCRVLTWGSAIFTGLCYSCIFLIL